MQKKSGESSESSTEKKYEAFAGVCSARDVSREMFEDAVKLCSMRNGFNVDTPCAKCLKWAQVDVQHFRV